MFLRGGVEQSLVDSKLQHGEHSLIGLSCRGMENNKGLVTCTAWRGRSNRMCLPNAVAEEQCILRRLHACGQILDWFSPCCGGDKGYEKMR